MGNSLKNGPSGYGRATAAWLVIVLLSSAIGRASAQVQNGISSPREGDILTGLVRVDGTATDPAFLRYELAFNSNGEWIVFAEGDQPVRSGTLAIWDTTVGQPTAPVFPDGTYQLRLRVVRQDYNYDEYVVRGLIINNSLPTPTATLAVATREVVTVTSLPQSSSGTPTPLPSLTPFPTPTALRRATPTAPSMVMPSGDSLPPGVTDVDAGQAGWAQRLRAVDTTRFSRAFWHGTRLSALAFAALAFYLLFRALSRRFWHFFWRRRR